jgi:hypothetical protein
MTATERSIRSQQRMRERLKQLESTYNVSTVGGPLTEPSIIARCDHEGDARRISMLWSRQYKVETTIATPSGLMIRTNTDGQHSA